MQEGVDVAIATNMMIAAFDPKISKIVLVSGDGDFCYCIDKVQSLV